jgi:hypothetical protein
MATNRRLFKTAPLIAPEPPRLASAPMQYSPQFQEQFANILRLYFNRLHNFEQLFTTSTGGSLLQFPSASFQDNTNQSASVTYQTPLTFTQIDYSNNFLLSDQLASFTGSRSGSTLTVSALGSGYIYNGMHIIGTGWESAVFTATIGVVTISGTPTANVMTVTAVASGTLAVGQYLKDGTGLVTGARIAQLISGTGSTGTYLINIPDGTNVVLGSETITGYGTHITNQLTGTAGGVGTYSVSTSGTIASTTLEGRATSKIVAGVAGTYNIQWSGQFSSLSNASETAYVWIRINGVDLAGSTGRVGLLQRKSAGVSNDMVVGWNYYINLKAGDYVELFWLVSNATDVTIATFPKSTSPAYPSTASVIATIGFVSALYT